jgi:8-oxo-dGTP diphosphatase
MSAVRDTWILPEYSPALQAGDYTKRKKSPQDHWGVRVILIRDDHVIVVQHHEKKSGRAFWLFPGGGVETGETVMEAGVREVKEETGLDVRIESLLYIREALPGEIEFYVLASGGDGELVLGTDPDKQEQVLRDVALVPLSELQDLDSFILYPRTIQRRLKQDFAAIWPRVFYLGFAE